MTKKIPIGAQLLMVSDAEGHSRGGEDRGGDARSCLAAHSGNGTSGHHQGDAGRKDAHQPRAGGPDPEGQGEHHDRIPSNAPPHWSAASCGWSWSERGQGDAADEKLQRTDPCTTLPSARGPQSTHCDRSEPLDDPGTASIVPSVVVSIPRLGRIIAIAATHPRRQFRLVSDQAVALRRRRLCHSVVPLLDALQQPGRGVRAGNGLRGAAGAGRGHRDRRRCL